MLKLNVQNSTLKTQCSGKTLKSTIFSNHSWLLPSMTLSRCVWASLPPCILLQVCLGISSPLHPVCPFPFINHETNAFSMASRYTPLATRQFLSTWLCNWVNYVHLISVVLVHIVHVRDTSNYDESSSLGTLVPLQSSNFFLCLHGPPHLPPMVVL